MGVLISLGLLAFATASARAADGQADPTFGSGGASLFDVGFGDYHPFALAASQAIEPSGDVVIAGASGDSGGDFDLLVARLTPSGALDPSFGDGGVVDLNLQDPGDDQRDSHATSVAIASDGDIVVGGDVPDGVPDPGYGVVIRLTPDGLLDPSFGEDGEVMLREGDINGLALTPGGEVVVTGSGPVGPGASTSPPCCLMVAELTSNGGLDGAFGNGGVTMEPDSGRMVARSVGDQVVVEGNGSIDVLGDGLDDGSGDGTGFIARFTTAGILDPSFGSSGFASLDLPGLDDPDAEDLVATSSGLVATASQTDPGNGDDSQTVVERFLASGGPDTGFGANGAVVLSGGVHPGVDEQGDALAVRPDGSMLIAGTTQPYGIGPSDVWMLSADGVPDDGFAGSDEESLPGDLTAASTQADGKVVLVGGAEQTDQSVDLEAVRLLGPGNTAPVTSGPDPATPGPSTGNTPRSSATATAGSGAPTEAGGDPVAAPTDTTTSSRPPRARNVLSLPAHINCRGVSPDAHPARTVCTVRIHSSAGGRVAAVLSRGAHTIVRFAGRVTRGHQALTIILNRRIARGRYRLVLTISHAGGRLITRREVRVSS